MPRLFLGLGVQNRRKVGGGAAPTTLPLSTSTFTITNLVAGRASNGQYNRIPSVPIWEFDNTGNDGNYYVLNYGFPYAGRWSLYFTDTDGFNYEISSNSAPSTAIPLTGWTPAVTIVTP
jgi:hypothetical protein